MKTLLIACASLAALAAASVPATAAEAPAGETHIGDWGFDLAGRDLAVRPGDDFNRYANGAALARMTIPADRSRFGAFDALEQLSENRTRAILEEAAAKGGEGPGNEAKIGAFYRAYMDAPRIEALGLKPLEPQLGQIRSAQTREDLAAVMGRAPEGLQASIFGTYVNVDAKDPSTYVLYVTQSGLGMPDRDYYLKPEFAAKKAAYRLYVARMLRLLGWPDAEARADAILAYETRIAEASWPAADRRNPEATYNPYQVADLATVAPGFAWSRSFAAAGLPATGKVVVREKTAVPKIAAIFAETPIETLKAWSAFHLADNAAPYLPDRFVQAHFDFRDKTLSGTPELEPRWRRAVNAVGSLRSGMGDAVGQVYVARYFPPEAKAKMETLVENLRAAFRHRIETSQWMSPETKTAALEKLARYQIKIGYTSEWRDYDALRISDQDLLGDVERSIAATWIHDSRRIGRPVDRAEWHMTPQTVNAYNNPSLNEVVFPAAILQPPFFDPHADPAVNYGAIVAVIGHEMTHGFDDQGRKFDATGRLRDWWTPADAAQFEARAASYGAEFAAIDTGSSVHINPRLTMGENIADLGGLNTALDAYHASLDGKPAPVIDGLTGDQRFFLGWAQVWRAVYRPDALKRQLVTDPHAPDMARAETAERNIDAWYRAFDVTPDETLYIPPDKRVTIW